MFGLMRSKKQHGPTIVRNVVDQFQKLIDDLSLARQLCEDDIVNNESTIRFLKGENDFLKISQRQAEILSDNLRQFIGTKESEHGRQN